MNSLHSIWKKISTEKNLLLLITSLIMMFGAFYNWYPFFTGDTSVYIASGFENYVPGERPVFYGWFIRFSSLGFSLWLTAFAQSLILSYLLLRILRAVLPDQSKWIYLSCVLAIAIFTGVWWESTKLIPDVFIATLTLALILLLFFKNTRTHTIILWTIVCVSSVVHLSHLAALTLLLLIIVTFNSFNSRRKEFILPAVLSLSISYLALIGSNMILEDKLTLANSNSVFLLGKMNEMGVLDVYLNEECSKQDLKLCKYKDSLPPTGWQFVWDKNGAVMKLGGWDENKEEHDKILRDIFTTPSYYPMLVFKATTNTLVQLSQNKVGDNLFRQEIKSNSIEAIGKYYPHEKNTAIWTKQFLMDLPFNGLSWFYLFVMLVLILLRVYLRSSFISPQIYYFLLLMLVLNAFTTANLANIASRLNERLLWLLPAFLLIELIVHIKKNTSGPINSQEKQ